MTSLRTFLSLSINCAATSASLSSRKKLRNKIPHIIADNTLHIKSHMPKSVEPKNFPPTVPKRKTGPAVEVNTAAFLHCV